MKSKVVLYGISYEYYSGDEYKEPLATFTNYDLAKAYAESSKLKVPRHHKFPFKKRSLLSLYEDYEIDGWYDLYHDPKPPA